RRPRPRALVGRSRAPHPARPDPRERGVRPAAAVTRIAIHRSLVLRDHTERDMPCGLDNNVQQNVGGDMQDETTGTNWGQGQQEPGSMWPAPQPPAPTPAAPKPATSGGG